MKAIAPEAVLVDEQGNSQPIKALNGAFAIDLPGAVCTQRIGCFIGGAPRLLVEQGASGGRQALGAVSTKAGTPKPERKPLPAWKSRLLDD